MASGVATVEIKSGYGLDFDSEIKMLEVARRIGEASNVSVRTTLLAAHTVPPEFSGNADAYVDLICDELLPEVAKRQLADAVDAYCETIAFTPEQVQRVFEAARSAGLPVKLHADQLSDGGGATLAARFDALSADLDYRNGVNSLFTRPTLPAPPDQVWLTDADLAFPLRDSANPASDNLKDNLAAFKAILAGEHDDLPEQAFYMVGGIDEAVEKAKSMQ